eukprot:TRINITY_DN10056_c0_g2_i3.p1 TRINITY_DN10056_c0_g2~~TRINITY_DN10056_c0_g2_i3.p1  ORF type:complete len:576 (+),score=140.47 TRINITY_DN10056_c0_g2_i3:427-2154(+)
MVLNPSGFTTIKQTKEMLLGQPFCVYGELHAELVARYIVENNQSPQDKYLFDENAKIENNMVKCILKTLIKKIVFLSERQESSCFRTITRYIRSCYDGLKLSLRQKTSDNPSINWNQLVQALLNYQIELTPLQEKYMKIEVLKFCPTLDVIYYIDLFNKFNKELSPELDVMGDGSPLSEERKGDKDDNSSPSSGEVLINKKDSDKPKYKQDSFSLKLTELQNSSNKNSNQASSKITSKKEIEIPTQSKPANQETMAKNFQPQPTNQLAQSKPVDIKQPSIDTNLQSTQVNQQSNGPTELSSNKGSLIGSKIIESVKQPESNKTSDQKKITLVLNQEPQQIQEQKQESSKLEIQKPLQDQTAQNNLRQTQSQVQSQKISLQLPQTQSLAQPTSNQQVQLQIAQQNSYLSQQQSQVQSNSPQEQKLQEGEKGEFEEEKQEENEYDQQEFDNQQNMSEEQQQEGEQQQQNQDNENGYNQEIDENQIQEQGQQQYYDEKGNQLVEQDENNQQELDEEEYMAQMQMNEQLQYLQQQYVDSQEEEQGDDDQEFDNQNNQIEDENVENEEDQQQHQQDNEEQ